MSFLVFIFFIVIFVLVIGFSVVGRLLGGVFNLFRSDSSKSRNYRRENQGGSYDSSYKKEYDEDDLVRSEEGEKRMKIFKESAESVDYEEVK